MLYCIKMKSLKFDHKQAQLILDGQKTNTWRLYDDKDIAVGDEINIIDKIDPGNPATWKVIGTAHIDAIIQKRLGKVDESDYQGHEKFTTIEQLVKTYQAYYGPQVDLQTPVKIIHFTFSPAGKQRDNDVEENTTELTEVKMYADGGSRGNPGPSASGFAILTMDGQIVVKKGVYLGLTTNNQAEYQALKLGLEEAKKMRVQIVHVYLDSLLVVNQMLGIFKVKNRDLWPIHVSIKELVTSFKQVSFMHVPRELNKIADSAVNEALDAAAKQ
jgi:ribonuclease HI